MLRFDLIAPLGAQSFLLAVVEYAVSLKMDRRPLKGAKSFHSRLPFDPIGPRQMYGNMAYQ